MPPHDTYVGIPPPPLPHFYQSDKADHGRSSSPKRWRSSTYTTANDHDNGPSLCIVADESNAAKSLPEDSMAMSLLPAYHICGTCHRRRSARYHREHPIPHDGVPPPPSTCRRCTLASENKDEVTTRALDKYTSTDIKLGVKCLVPNDDCFPNNPSNPTRANRISRDPVERPLDLAAETRQNEGEHFRLSRQISYRHIRIPEPSSPAPISNQHDASHAGRSPDSNIQVSTAIRQDGHSLGSCSKVGEVSTSEPLLTEVNIRAMARDEVRRYREAERKLEAHRRAYSHGQLVPIKPMPTVQRTASPEKIIKQVPKESRSAELAARRIYNKDIGNASIKAEQNLTQNDGRIRSANKHPPTIKVSDKTLWPKERNELSHSRPRNVNGGPSHEARQKGLQNEVTSRPSKEGSTQQQLPRQRNASDGPPVLASHCDRQRSSLVADNDSQRIRTQAEGPPPPLPSLHLRHSAVMRRGDEKSDYYYRRRVIMPVHGQLSDHSDRDCNYQGTEERLYQRPGSGEGATRRSKASSRPRTPERQASVTSSRVRFANKVDMSPTPPGSDASSSRFRKVESGAGRPNRLHKDCDNTATLVYEHRGRTRSRDHQVRHNGERAADSIRHGSVSRFGELQGRVSDQQRVGFSGWAGVHSESPSREWFGGEEVRRSSGPVGPYAGERERSVSERVEDGSSASSAGRSGPDRSYRRGLGRGGSRA